MDKISLIIPVYNGAEVLPNTFIKIADFVNNFDVLDQIIFVDDGSTDKTLELLQNFKIQCKTVSITICSYKINRGKGYAIKYASKYLNEQNSYVGFTDVELPYGLHKLKEVQTNLSKYDMVVGNRENKNERQYSLYRYVMNKLFRLFIPKEVWGFKDTQCGFKFFRIDIFQDIFSRVMTFRWVFDIELFIIASIYKYSIYELSVSIDKKLLNKKGGVSFFRHSMYILTDLFLIKNNLKSGIYEK